MKRERSKVTSARTAINLLEASQNAINEIRQKFDDVKEHIHKKKLPRKNQILELSFKHSMIERIVKAVDDIKSIQTPTGILKELRQKIKDEKVFERELLDIHAEIERLETLRDSLHSMVRAACTRASLGQALDPTCVFAPSDDAEHWASEKFAPLKPVVALFEKAMWYYVEDCLHIAMEKPGVLVKIMQIIEYETMRDVDRKELGEPFRAKEWQEVCDEKLMEFVNKRFKFFETEDPKEKPSERDKAHEEGELTKGELSIVAKHLAGCGVTVEELHRRVDDLGNIKEYLIPCFPTEAKGNEVISRGEAVSRRLFDEFHKRIYEFLRFLTEQKNMLIVAPRSIIKYIDFVENYYWRMEDQLFVDTESLHECHRWKDLRNKISWPLRKFYLEGMGRKFTQFAEEIVRRDYEGAATAKPVEGGEHDGLLQSAAVQDVFNMLYQNVKTIEGMNDPVFLSEGYVALGKCLHSYATIVSRSLQELEHEGTAGGKYLFGAITVNNTVPFVKQADIFISKALASCGEYAATLVTEEEDFDDIISKLQDVQQEAMSSTANALLKRAVDKYIPYIFVPGKWYPSKMKPRKEEDGRKEKAGRMPAVVSIADELHAAFEKLQPTLPTWEMKQLLVLVLQKLLSHYCYLMFSSDDIKMGERERGAMSPWKRTPYFLEDMHMISELFKYWVHKTDPMEDAENLVDGEHLAVMHMLLDLINMPPAHSIEFQDAVKQLATRCPDFNDDKLIHIIDQRKTLDNMTQVLREKLHEGQAESKPDSIGFMPFSRVIRAPEGEQEEEPDQEQQMREEMQEEKAKDETAKIQAAFDEATIELENMGDEAMDFDEFVA